MMMKGWPSVGLAAVEQPRDVRVGEVGEGLALALEALDQRVGQHARPDDLDGDGVLEIAAVALGPEHRAHAAVAELVDDAVGPALGRCRVRVGQRQAAPPVWIETGSSRSELSSASAWRRNSSGRSARLSM